MKSSKVRVLREENMNKKVEVEGVLEFACKFLNTNYCSKLSTLNLSDTQVITKLLKLRITSMI